MQIWGNRACFLSPSVLRSLFYTLGVMRVSSQEMSLEGNTAAYYCSWKCGLGFWHSGDLFSPGQNGKSDVVSETPTEGQERGGDGMSLKPQGVLWRQGGKVDWDIWGGQLGIKSTIINRKQLRFSHPATLIFFPTKLSHQDEWSQVNN